NLIKDGAITFPPMKPHTSFDPTRPTPTWYKEHDFYNYHRVKGHSDGNCITFKNFVQEMLEKGELTLDNPNAPTNQNLHIFKKPFPNHAPFSDQMGETSTHDSHTREVHGIFNDTPNVPQLPHIPYIEEILAQSPPPTLEPTSPIPPPIEEHLSPPSSPVEEISINIETISPLASPPRESSPAVPLHSTEEYPPYPLPTKDHLSSPPPTEEHPSSPSPIKDPLEIPLPL
ncbi:hypothetical protein KI387_024217, partial [Taxus chinensis]